VSRQRIRKTDRQTSRTYQHDKAWQNRYVTND